MDQSHLDIRIPDTEEGEELNVAYIFPGGKNCRRWGDFPETKYFQDDSKFGKYYPLPAIEVLTRKDLEQERKVYEQIRVVDVNWKEIIQHSEEVHRDREQTPVVIAFWFAAFAACSDPTIVKMYFTGFRSMEQRLVTAAIQLFCKQLVLFLGFHRKRSTNTRSGYGFLFVDKETATKLKNKTIPLQHGQGAITFDYAMQGKRNGEGSGRGGGRGGREEVQRG